jgi:hypothetical protein
MTQGEHSRACSWTQAGLPTQYGCGAVEVPVLSGWLQTHLCQRSCVYCAAALQLIQGKALQTQTCRCSI